MDPPTINPDDELLIAYLDQELDRSATGKVEERLAVDPDFRARLDGLQRSWDALDELPRAPGNPASAASTLSLVALTAEQERSEPASARRANGWPGLRRAALMTAALLVGYAGLALPRHYRYLARLRDLPVAYQMDAYRIAGDLPFLRQLEQEGVFAEDIVGDDAEPADGPSSPSLLGLPRAPQAIQQVLTQLPVEVLSDLQVRANRFAQLPRSEQRSLRQFHDDLIADPAAEQLTVLLTRYHDWIATLPSADRAELMQLAPDARMDKVRKLVADQLRRHPDWLAVTAGDLRHLQVWTADYVTRHADELLALLPTHQQELLRRVEPRRRSWLLVRAIANAPHQVKDHLPELSDEETIRFLDGFTPPMRQRVSATLQARGSRAIFEAFPILPVQRRGNPRRLEQFFDGLPPEEQEALLQLGPERLPQELRDRFWRREGEGAPGRRPGAQTDDRPRRPPWPPDPDRPGPRRPPGRPPRSGPDG